MSEGFKFQASVKDADGDMVNVRADSPEELDAYLSNFPVAAYAQFKANVRGGQALGAVVQPAPAQPVQQQAPAQPQWGNPPVQEVVPSWAAQSAQPQQQVAAPLPPGSRVCELPTCNNLLEHKATTSGKAVLRCPDWRWNNGNPNGHSSEFVN